MVSTSMTAGPDGDVGVTTVPFVVVFAVALFLKFISVDFDASGVPAPAFIALIRKNNPVRRAARSRRPKHPHKHGDVFFFATYPELSYNFFLCYRS